MRLVSPSDKTNHTLLHTGASVVQPCYCYERECLYLVPTIIILEPQAHTTFRMFQVTTLHYNNLAQREVDTAILGYKSTDLLPYLLHSETQIASINETETEPLFLLFSAGYN